MNEVMKCRVMPNGTPSVMTFLLYVRNEETDLARVTFLSMNGWNHFDCEEIDEWPYEYDEHRWEVAEQAAIELMWNLIKVRLFDD